MTQELIRELLNDEGSLQVYLEGNIEIYAEKITNITEYLYTLLENYQSNGNNIEDVLSLLNTIILREEDLDKLNKISDSINQLKSKAYRNLTPKSKPELFDKVKKIGKAYQLVGRLIRESKNNIIIDKSVEYLLSKRDLGVLTNLIRDNKNILSHKGFGEEDILKRLLRLYSESVKSVIYEPKKTYFLCQAILMIVNNEKLTPEIVRNADSYVTLLDGLVGDEVDYIRKSITKKEKEKVYLQDLADLFNIALDYPKHIEDVYESLSRPLGNGYDDYTDQLVFTIDGPETSCLDDGFSIIRCKDGRMFVCAKFTFVPALVPFDSPINHVAWKRVETTYTRDKAFSLYPNQLAYHDLSLVSDGNLKYVEFGIWEVMPDFTLDIDSFKLKKAIIKPSFQLTYADADRIISSKSDTQLCHDLTDLGRITAKLSKLKNRNVFDEEMRGIEKEVPLIYGDNPRWADEVFFSASIVQTFALLFGHCKGKLFKKNGYPFVYRTCDVLKPFNLKECRASEDISNIFKQSTGAYYSMEPKIHEVLEFLYARCGSAARRYPDALNQYLSEVFFHAPRMLPDKELYKWEDIVKEAIKVFNSHDQNLKGFNHVCGFHAKEGTLVRGRKPQI